MQRPTAVIDRWPGHFGGNVTDGTASFGVPFYVCGGPCAIDYLWLHDIFQPFWAENGFMHEIDSVAWISLLSYSDEIHAKETGTACRHGHSG